MFDGDQLALTLFYGKESVERIDEYLASATTYFDAMGNLNLSNDEDVAHWCLGFTTGLVK